MSDSISALKFDEHSRRRTGLGILKQCIRKKLYGMFSCLLRPILHSPHSCHSHIAAYGVCYTSSLVQSSNGDRNDDGDT
jgi:hypothetical protein